MIGFIKIVAVVLGLHISLVTVNQIDKKHYERNKPVKITNDAGKIITMRAITYKRLRIDEAKRLKRKSTTKEERNTHKQSIKTLRRHGL